MVLRKEAAVVSSPDSATSALKSTMNSIASTVYSSPSATFSSTFREIADVTVLKEAVEVDRLFMVEMNAASAFLDALESQSAPMLNSRNIGFSPDYFSVSLTRLNNIWEMYGADSKEFTVASAILTTIVTKLLNVFEATYPNLSVQILTVIPLSRVTNRRDGLPPGLDRRLASVNVHCPQFFKDCMTLSNNCSNHGMCALAPNPRASNQSCFFCSCYTNNTDDNGELIIGGSNRKVLWAGPACAQQDISSEFHLLFWTTVGIAIVVVFVVGLLASVGSEDSNTAGAGSGKSKDD
ncbi:hypothetical protein BC830DRAFT_423942 [Chytriomyces sp. MP71]|nr:hypothetical protein BC830DRAFT_423942 [Chytriomyces sp. MP71]